MWASHENLAGNFPDFLVVGAAKSGTTSLHNYLRLHPEIFLPQDKELYFWHLKRNPNKAILGALPEQNIPETLDSYLGHFTSAERHQIVGEVCPSYLYYHDYVIASLKELHPRCSEVKIVIILRDPVDRILSQYRFVRQRSLDPDGLNLEQALEMEDERARRDGLLADVLYRSLSSYSAQIEAYMDAFDDVHVCLYDDLKSSPDEVVSGIFEFLGVPNLTLDDDVLRTKHNASEWAPRQRFQGSGSLYTWLRKSARLVPLSVRKPASKTVRKVLFGREQVSERTVRKLRQSLAGEVEATERLIGRDLSSWK